MANEIINFLKHLAIAKHGSLEKARFAIVRDEVSCRCVYCLDSKKNTRKKRFYYSLKDNVYFCFNCQRRGNLSHLLRDFRNIPHIDYAKLEKEIDQQDIQDFIKGEQKPQEVADRPHQWILEYPEGSRLDVLLEGKIYKKLPTEDKTSLLRVIQYLKDRGVKKEWYRYFYFVFPGQDYDQYVLSLFEHNGEWIWSGRKIDPNRPGSKYHHLPGFPFQDALGFANEVSLTKGSSLYIVESWFSALLMNQENMNSVCVFGLQNMRLDHPPLDIFKKKYELVWVPDNDESLAELMRLNNSLTKKMRTILVPDKDVGDMVTRLGDVFRKEFLRIPVRSLYDQDSLRKLKTII